jgi:hypothetical protein
VQQECTKSAWHCRRLMHRLIHGHCKAPLTSGGLTPPCASLSPLDECARSSLLCSPLARWRLMSTVPLPLGPMVRMVALRVAATEPAWPEMLLSMDCPPVPKCPLAHCGTLVAVAMAGAIVDGRGDAPPEKQPSISASSSMTTVAWTDAAACGPSSASPAARGAST